MVRFFPIASSLTTLQLAKNALYWGSGLKSGWEDMQWDCSSVGGVLTTASRPDCVREEMVTVDLWYSSRLVSGEIAGFACEDEESKWSGWKDG